MQDKATGEMIPIGETNKYPISVPMQNELSKHGFCLLSVGEKVNIKDVDFTVKSFDKHHVLFEVPEQFNDMVIMGKLKLKIGEQLKIKNGNFKVEHYGTQFLKVRGLPANEVISQKLIDKIRKQQIESLRKEEKHVLL